MNNSSLFECSIAPQNQILDRTLCIILKTIKILFIILAIITAIYAFYFSNFMWIVTLVLILLSIITGVIQEKFYNFYDYTFCEDEIRITKVINNKRRVFLTRFKLKDVVKIGFVSGKTYEKLSQNKEYKKIYAKSKILDVTNLYFEVNANGEHNLIILAFNKKFLSGVFQKLPSKHFDEDFTKLLEEYEKYNLS